MRFDDPDDWPEMMPRLTANDFVRLQGTQGDGDDPNQQFCKRCLVSWLRVSFQDTSTGWQAPVPRNMVAFAAVLLQHLTSVCRQPYGIPHELFSAIIYLLDTRKVTFEQAAEAWAKTLAEFGYEDTEEEYVVPGMQEAA